MGWLGIPLTIVGLALLIHGFPNIHIGSKTIKNYYNTEEEDDDSED